MLDLPVQDSAPRSRLDQISTRWAAVRDPIKFLMRYGPAIGKYLSALLKNEHDAEEASQEFLLRVLEHGFAAADPDRGRFRDYLKRAVRNAALTRLRKKQVMLQEESALDAFLATDSAASADRTFLDDWRGCLLDRVWRKLQGHQQRKAGNRFHTVLRLTVDHPEADSETLAALVADQHGTPLRADAFRKQLSRARQLFARLLIAEVAQTLERPTPELLQEELTELGLIDYVRDHLPLS